MGQKPKQAEDEEAEDSEKNPGNAEGKGEEEEDQTGKMPEKEVEVVEGKGAEQEVKEEEEDLTDIKKKPAVMKKPARKREVKDPRIPYVVAGWCIVERTPDDPANIVFRATKEHSVWEALNR